MTPQSWVGKTIGGRYQIEILLGQGGMSAVYRAFDPNLRRVVAIKLIHAHLSTDPNFVGRFKEEATAVARLRHPNIVQVHDFDIDGETYYMVMEYLIGETLQARLKRLNSTGRYMSLPEAVRISTQMCDAAGYAHNHELVHRDIKPANIMLDVNRQAILMDFGIVKIVGGEYHTATGATIGTAMYMSPEQIRSERIDDRSDIYSLGVTLYEMISGRPPYQADSALTLMMMVLNDPLPDLREIREGVPDELLAVVYKALAKERMERFQSMAEMSAALLQVQGKIVSTPSVLTVVDDRQAEQAQPTGPPPQGTSTAKDMMPHSIKGETPPAIESEVISASQNLECQEATISSIPLEQDVPVEPASTPIRLSKPKAKNAVRLGSRRILKTAIAILFLLALIFASFLYLSSKWPPNLQLAPITNSQFPLNAQTAQGIVSLGMWDTDSIVVDLAFSPDGALLGTANSREWVRLSQYRFYGSLWQVETGSLQRYLLRHTQPVTGVAFSPDGQYIATASDDASLILWQVQEGSLVRTIEASMGGITSVDFSPNNMLLAAGSWDGIVGLWQVNNGNLLRTLREQEYGIKDVEFSPDGSMLAAASYNNTILIWRVSDGSLVQILRGHTAAVDRVAFSPDGTLLASASEDHTIGLWQVSDGNLMRSLQGHSETVKDVAFSPDGSLLASGSEDGTLRLWQVTNGHLLSNLSEQDSILSIAFSPDGYYLVTGVANRVLHFWGISEAIPIEIVPTPTSP